MKHNQIALAVALAAVSGIASAGITVTPFMVGYQVFDNKTPDEIKVENTNGIAQPVAGRYGWGVDPKDDVYAAAAIGFDITDNLEAEVQYGQTNGDGRIVNIINTAIDANAANNSMARKGNMKTTSLTGNMIYKLGTMESAFRPYLLVGAGHQEISSTDLGDKGAMASSEDTIGNLGVGAYMRLNDALNLRGEVRGVHNFDKGLTNGIALMGLQVAMGRNKPVPVAPPAPMPEPVPAPVAPMPVDSDGDGVTDDMDQCPNTPRGTVVDERGCPKVLVDDLSMELRVFFDTNKSVIKQQYRPEIARVAEKMREYSNANARIEGHTDIRGSRRLNDRLSLARANAVKDMLVREYGIDSGRISTIGYAYTRPIAPNNTPEGMALNRRVYAVIQGSKSQAQMGGAMSNSGSMNNMNMNNSNSTMMP